MTVDTVPRFTSEEARSVAEGSFVVLGTATPLPSERDQNFLLTTERGDRYVLKIANSAEDPAVLQFQNAALKHAAKAAISVDFPRIISARHGDDIVQVNHGGREYLVRLVTWLSGDTLVQTQPHTPELLRSLGAALADLDHALQDFSHPAMKRVLHWDLWHAPLLTKHGSLLSPGRQALIQRFMKEWHAIDWSRLRCSVIHGDANDHNVLVQQNRVSGFLDFGDMVHSATVCDLAIAIAYAMLGKSDPLAAAHEIAMAYHERLPLTAAEQEGLLPLTLSRLCMSVCYAAYNALAKPDDPYQLVTQAPAWELLERLAALPSGDLRMSLPNPSADTLLKARKKVVGPNLSIAYRKPLHIVRGEGACLYDSEGRAFLDCVNNVAHVGHCHPRILRAATEQMRLLNTNTRYLHERLIEYSERLTATLPRSLNVVYLVCSGSEANELALRLARAHTQRQLVLVLDAAYHGNTNALIDMSPYKHAAPGGRGRPPWVEVASLPDVYRGAHRGSDAGARYAAEISAALRSREDIAAFFVESAPGCGGQIILPPGYLVDAFAAVRATGGVCVADEVQTGLGRAGTHFWMFETQDAVPDIVTVGKPIGNGHPMAAVVTTRDIAASFDNGMEYFNTFGGNPVSCAVGLAVLDIIRDEGLQAHALEIGNHLLEGFRELAQRHPLIGDVRGRGLYIGIELVRNRKTQEPAAQEAADVINQLRDRGILLSTDGPLHNVIKIKPPLVFSRADADRVLEQLDEVLART